MKLAQPPVALDTGRMEILDEVVLPALSCTAAAVLLVFILGAI